MAFSYWIRNCILRGSPRGAFFHEQWAVGVSQFRFPHAISYEKDSLCTLISLGDARAKVFVQELDPDPTKAAEDVVTDLQALLNLA